MICLTREVRFSAVAEAANRPLSNSWGGWPAASEISPWLVFRCTLAGELEPQSGYLCNIKLIDDALRHNVIAELGQFSGQSFEWLLQFAYARVKDKFPSHCHIQCLELCATPTLSYKLRSGEESMVQMTQQFEFSASHRLHNPELSDQENRNLFGKCNNPHGHGHNYVVMVTVQGEPGESGTVVPIEPFEKLVKQQVVDRMDHRNLNVELEEFQARNPSVENIAIVIWELLESSIASLCEGRSHLSRIRVYETPKTWADYRGSAS